MDDHDQSGQDHLPTPQAAHLLLEDAFRPSPVPDRTFSLDDLPRGLTIVEVPDTVWLWPMVHRLEAQTARRGGQCFVNTVPRPAKAAKANRFDWMLEEQDPVLHWPESGTPVAIIKKPMDRNLPRPRAPEFAYDQRASFHYPLNQRVADRRASPKCPKAPPRTAISFPITAEIIENQSPTQTARKMCECRSSSEGGHY